jgi:hypothetical protein
VYRTISPLIKRGADEARDAAEAQAMLNATAAESAPLINAYAEAEMRRLAIDDEVIIKMAAQIAARGKTLGLQGEELKLATKLGIQYGALRGNYETAAAAVGKYLTGAKGEGGLKGINVELTKGADLHEKLEAALKATAGGMEIAEAQANTAAGAFKGFNLQIDEYLGKLTAAITDNPKVAAAFRELTDLVADEVASGDLKEFASDVGDIASELVELAKVGKTLQPLTDFLGGKWLFQLTAAGDNAIGKPMRDFVFGLKDAEGETKKVETAALAVAGAFADSAENIDEMTDGLKAVAKEADAIAKAQKEADAQYYDWKSAREKRFIDERKAAYDSMMEHVKQLDEAHLARVQKELELRQKMLENYQSANASAQGWIRQGDRQLAQIESVADKIGKAIKHGADSTDRMNVVTIAAARNISVMADEMEKTADAAERTKSAVMFTELARSSSGSMIDWQKILRDKGIGTADMTQLELAQIQYTRKQQGLGPLQMRAQMDTGSVLMALQLAIQDLQLTLRERQLRESIAPTGTRSNPLYVNTGADGSAMLGVI